MNRKNIIYLLLGTSVLLLCTLVQAQQITVIDTNSNSIALAGNAFVTKGKGAQISRKVGLVNWVDQQTMVSIYFRVQEAGKIGIKLRAFNPDKGTSRVQIKALGRKKTVQVQGTDGGLTEELEVDVKEPGYVRVDLQGVVKTGRVFADVTDLIVTERGSAGALLYANDPEYYYWARRGPSCHINYSIPTERDVSYYYNEVTVPKGEDKIGSYYMANGFGEGYFGIQVNSDTERRILFSVWSPFHTDDPKSIPEDQKIKMLKKGKDVQTGEFGNEGAGGQSFRRYHWQAGVTYRFLLKGAPDGQGNTDYTAWFFVPEENAWSLIASFKRPKTNTYLKRFHSFLENFNPDQGYLGRQVEFKNQWVYDGAWKAVSSASFSVDATYRANQRIDAIGGINADGYFLRNGGFFNERVDPGAKFAFQNRNKPPQIDFSTLP
ncbi:DUF3472 domain-containing protein [Sphingobacterium sp. SGG-5]|uniref:DUF3472 domain-containing protein n=1 Tax=Sphingobacterium sp. SGG-5 TaxID=2710881 RepID=UPI0013EB8275|nr:DUF3472 domain-containing protein [Sphingobacterium sp. SGG-5]NGM61616.1 DUF3472 domain-containing protein [Sphingobacterium sp. SGG-5]